MAEADKTSASIAFAAGGSWLSYPCKGGGSCVGRPLRRLTNACLHGRSQGASLGIRIGGEDVESQHQLGAIQLLRTAENGRGKSLWPASSGAGAKCEAKANGKPNAAATWAPNRLEPRITRAPSIRRRGPAMTR